MKWLTLFTALLLAACAAYFSIVGLMTIFAGAAISVMIMGAVLEFAKLVSAAWLHYEWPKINNLVRTYFTVAVLVLMFITSMGIFGYLSKAHVDQTVQTGGTNELQIENLERRIQREQAIIRDSEKVVAQLDNAVETLQEYDRIRGPDGAIAVRAAQTEERESLNQTIENAYSKIETLQTELLPLKKQQISLEAEIGPLKYIAELVYGQEQARDNFDVAVRGIILLLVFVFDPLAIMLLIVSTAAFKNDRLKIKPLINEDQIMRMDIDDRNNSNVANSRDEPILSESDTRKADNKKDDKDHSFVGNTAGEDIYLQSEWNVGIDGSSGEKPKSVDLKKEGEGNLYTTVARRPIK